MIVVTRLNGSRFAVNPDLIERIHAQPDTTLFMVDDAKYIVTESMDEVIDRIAGYRAHIISLARRLDVGEPGESVGPLAIVPRDDDSDNPASRDNTVALRHRNK